MEQAATEYLTSLRVKYQRLRKDESTAMELLFVGVHVRLTDKAEWISSTTRVRVATDQ